MYKKAHVPQARNFSSFYNFLFIYSYLVILAMILLPINTQKEKGILPLYQEFFSFQDISDALWGLPASDVVSVHVVLSLLFFFFFFSLLRDFRQLFTNATPTHYIMYRTGKGAMQFRPNYDVFDDSKSAQLLKLLLCYMKTFCGTRNY